MTKYCESCEGECLSDVMEYCECCGVGKRNGCEMNPSDESIFDGMCDECREEDPDDEECAECCNCGEDVSNDNGTGSLVGGEYWCKTCVEEEEDDDHDICGQTGGKCGDFAGCGKKVLCEDTNMLGNTSFCIPCYEKTFYKIVLYTMTGEE